MAEKGENHNRRHIKQDIKKQGFQQGFIWLSVSIGFDICKISNEATLRKLSRSLWELFFRVL